MMTDNINVVVKILKKELATGEMPIVSHLAENQRDPFMILISTLLSLRTKDEVTALATERLFSLASTPEEMLNAVKNNQLKVIEYSHSAGIESYRKRLVEYYNKYDIHLTYTDIMVTTGGSEAIEIAMMTIHEI